jgi:predicted nucleotide-binding protein (sugar kinase/HSP70/actin superfamily)
LPLRIGIPRGLLYYYYGDVWRDFCRALGAEPVVSPETTRSVLAAGGSIDEVCLPVKAFYGHALALAGKVDRLFLPRVVSLAPNHYTCPKIIGLPDIVRTSLPGGRPLSPRPSTCAPAASAYTGDNRRRRSPRALTALQPLCVAAGLADATLRKDARRQGREGGRPWVVLIGHPYILYDRQISMDVMGRLAALGMTVVTADRADRRAADRAASALPKNIFWHYCRCLAGAALAFLGAAAPPAGMIFLTSFACGPDSLIGELLRRRAEKRGVPFLLLALDEHTAEAGLVTRLEAFTDMLRRRQS